MYKSPTRAQWQTVIDNLKKVLPMATEDNQLDMMQPDVNGNNHECGTVHCVGGWYAIACGLHETGVVCFTHGVDLMAKHLGFHDKHQLLYWAKYSVVKWGNFFGDYMFADRRAYGGARNLAEVIAHLECVRDRSPLLELR